MTSMSTLTSTITLAPTVDTTGIGSGPANYTSVMMSTHTSSSLVPVSTIVMSLGVQGMVEARILAGIVGLATLAVTLVI
ncbi:hypothetical protein F4808DRAFT_413470 [Astrocystis sublimbata]|nr:hypothetical protein F4808DRAFT_413470 [Astrocystis sublimbata]